MHLDRDSRHSHYVYRNYIIPFRYLSFPGASLHTLENLNSEVMKFSSKQNMDIALKLLGYLNTKITNEKNPRVSVSKFSKCKSSAHSYYL